MNFTSCFFATVAFCVPAFVTPVQAVTLLGKVVTVTDGDTVKVLDASKTQLTVRLAGIDAPEKKMPFGQKAKEALSDLVFNKTVEVETEKVDRYGRSVGKILVNGRDANLAMVNAGMAWHYKKYEKEQSLSDRLLYANAEQEARTRKVGLWHDPTPVPPWEWRHESALRTSP
jgi:endonuclease YncB( thermonuclease family)